MVVGETRIDDNYLHEVIFPDHPPITWGQNIAINNKVAEINRSIVEKDYNVLIGSEQEFILAELANHPLKIDINQKREDVQNQHKKQYAAKHHKSTFVDDPVFKEQQQAIAQFTAAELLMFELHADAKLVDILAPKFGTSHTGNGYYDVHDHVMEVDIKPAAPLEAIRRYRAFIAALDQKAQEYGLNISFYPRQISMSVTHEENGNPLDFSKSPPEKALPIVDGILKCAFDALPCLVRRYHLQHKLPCTSVDAGPDRINAIKIKTDAGKDSLVELRLNDNPRTGGHFAMAILTLLSGLKLGLQNPQVHTALSVSPSELQQRRRFTTQNKEMFFTAEVLNGADIMPDGTIAHFNKKQISQYMRHLAKEINYTLPEGQAPSIADTMRISNILKQLVITDNKITARADSHFADHPDVMAKIACIKREPQQTVIVNEGYFVDSPIEQIKCMAQSEPLRKLWGEKILKDVVIAHSHANKLDPSQFVLPVVVSAHR